MMQSPEAQYQLALKMPMNRLMGILQGKPDAVVGQPIAMLALQSLKEQKTAAQGMQAQQQLQQPNVKDQLLAEDQGIAVASAPNMNAVVNAAHGGIVGYDSGGAVQHFVGGGLGSNLPDFSRMTPEETRRYFESRANFEPRAIRDSYTSSRTPSSPRVTPTPGPGPSFASAFPGVAAEAQRALPFAQQIGKAGVTPVSALALAAGAGGFGLGRAAMGLTGGDQALTDYIADRTGLSDREDRMLPPQAPPGAFDKAFPAGPRSKAMQDLGVINSTYAAPQVAGPRIQAAPGQAPNSKTSPQATPRLRGQGALVSNRVFSTQGEAEPTQYADPAMPAAQGPQPSSREALSSYEDILGRSQAVTSDYKTQITDLVKQMTASPAEKDKERESRLGAGLLSIASDLLEPGQTSSGARGKTLKTIAGLATQYNKEDKADKRANLGVELSTRMGILQLEQGDRKNATDLFNHAQTISLQQADLAGKTAYQMAEIDAKKRGLSIEESKAFATEKHNAAYIGVMQEANRIRERVAGKQMIVQQTQNKKIDQANRAADLRAYVSSLEASLKNITNPEARKAAQKKIDELTASLGATLGFSSAAPSGPGFIPKPKSSNLMSDDVLGDD